MIQTPVPNKCLLDIELRRCPVPTYGHEKVSKLSKSCSVRPSFICTSLGSLPLPIISNLHGLCVGPKMHKYSQGGYAYLCVAN